MIRIPLTFHTPEVIYEFLEHKYGAHSMLLKKGQALVTFHKLELNDAAIKDYQHIVHGHPLRMHKYHDGDLERAAPAPPTTAMHPELEHNPENAAPHPPTLSVSPTAKIVEEATIVIDPEDALEVATKAHFKEVIEYVAKFQPLYSTAKAKEKELLSGEEERTAKDLSRYYEVQLGEVKSGVVGLYKKARSHLARFGKEKQRCEIDLEANLQPEPVHSLPLNTGKLRSYLHFANKDPCIEIKKLAALNDRQFVCSSYLIDRDRRAAAKGRIKVHGMEEQFEVMSALLPEGAYGLTVVEKYLLVGNLEGSVSFWNSSQGPFSPDAPFENSLKLHDGYIFELLKNGATSKGFGVVSLGIDFAIKFFEVCEDLITDDVVTLYFREEDKYCLGREVMSIDLMEERQRLVACSYNKIIAYDMPTRKEVSENTLRSNIFRIKRMRESLVAAANSSFLSFADPRGQGAVASCPLNQEVKALCVANENAACYGTSDGEIGIVDLRKPNAPYWRDQGTHHSRIYDILRMGDRLVSGDQKGLLVGWTSALTK